MLNNHTAQKQVGSLQNEKDKLFYWSSEIKRISVVSPQISLLDKAYCKYFA